VRVASKSRGVTKILARPVLWFCACNLLTAILAADCSSLSPRGVPDGTYTSGDHSQVDGNALSAANVGLSGGATATFVAGNCIQLLPNFHASAIGATVPTTFHAWVDVAPSAVSVSPTSGSGMSGQFTWTVSSPSGYGNLSHVFALFNTISDSTSNACFIHYDASSNLVYLADNASANWLGGFVPSGSGSASNSQCTITGTGSSPDPTSSGTQLGLTLTVAFQSSFSGSKNEYLYALDSSGVYTGWQQMGTWTVPAPPAPDFVLTTALDTYSVQTGMASTPSYTITVTPQNGFNSPVSFSASPFYGCGSASFNPSQVSGPPGRPRSPCHAMKRFGIPTGRRYRRRAEANRTNCGYTSRWHKTHNPYLLSGSALPAAATSHREAPGIALEATLPLLLRQPAATNSARGQVLILAAARQAT
jgi:hypothetical protein